MTTEILAQAVAMYRGGLSCRKIGDAFDMYPQTVHANLVKAGVKMRGNSESVRKFAVNDSAFSNMETEKQFYFCGLLITDGHIEQCSENGYSIGIDLQTCDRHMVVALRDFLSPQATVSDSVRKPDKNGRVYSSCYFKVKSKQIATDLLSLGVCAADYRSQQASDTLVGSRHFWRGVVDGDGWFGKDASGYWKLGLCGSLPLMEQFADYCTTVIHGFRPPITTNKSIWRIQVAGRKAVVLVGNLYGNCVIALNRKLTPALVAIAGPVSQSNRSMIYEPQTVTSGLSIPTPLKTAYPETGQPAR